MPSRCFKGCLPLTPPTDVDQMLRIPQVEVGEYSCPLEQLKRNGKKHEGVEILHSDIVKSPIVYARA